VTRLIPKLAVPSFYFEMTVLDAGLPASVFRGNGTAGDWHIAIGLFRAGFPIEGAPGAFTSYAYSAAQGNRYCGDGERERAEVDPTHEPIFSIIHIIHIVPSSKRNKIWVEH
jgi:hypothetical protein